MALGKRLINTGGVAACTTDSVDPFGDSSGVALYSLDYDASEASGTYDGTPTNVDFGVGGQINYGARFNGSSSKITLPTGTPFDSSNTIKCISAWIKPSTITSNVYIYSVSSTTDTKDYFTFDWVQSTWTGVPDLRVRVQNGDSTQKLDALVNVTATDDWVHVIAQLGTEVELYINSVKQTVTFDKAGSATNSWWINNISYSTSAQALIGQYRAVTPLNADGNIDQVRLFSKALNQSEVDSLYAETACVYTSTTDIVNYPTGTTPVAYYKLDNSSEDYSTGGNDGTDTNIEYRFGRYGQAAVFNGSSSKIVLPTSTFSPSTFTLSAWCNVTSDTAENTILELFDNQTYPNHTTIVFAAGSSGYSSRFLLRNYATNQYNYNPSGTVEKNVWKHYAMTYDGSTVKSYIDGSLVDSGSLTLSNTVGTITSIQLGLSSGTRYLNGAIDQVRIFSTALSSSQVTELYNEKPEVDTSNFKAVLYEGTGATQYISNVGMDLETDGGLVWIKNRNSTQSHRLYDSVRGANLQISSNQTASEGNSGGLTSFDSNGFSLDNWASVNTNGNTYVSWVWKGGGDAVNIAVNSITASTPSIASDVSANTDAGFSIVKYTGDGGTATLGHGLSQQVEMVITKSTESTSQWMIYHKDLTGNTSGDNPYNLYFATNNELDLTAFGTYDSFTDSVFPVSRQSASTAHNNNLNIDYIAYCFHSVSGYSKIGSYTGNGSSTGPIVYTTDDGTSSGSNGFEPRWVMIKRTDDTGNWYIVDSIRSTANPRNDRLLANTSNSEVSYTPGNIDFLSNGFQLKGTYGSTNALNGTYIYMAFK